MILYQYNIDLEVKLNGMDNYDTIKTDQDSIDMAKLIIGVCPLQDNNKKYVMTVVETDKQVYLLYQAPYQSNTGYLEDFKSHLKFSEAHDGSVGYHPGLAASTLL